MFKYLHYAPCLLAIFALTACGSDDDNPEAPSNPTEKEEGNKESMTPEESKEYLESVAKDVLNMFNPSDQEATIKFLDRFQSLYGDLDMPENWEDDDMSPSYVCRNLRSPLSRTDYTGISRAFYTYTWNFDRLRGVYEPQSYSWVKTADSQDIIFKCIVDGKATEFKAVASGGNNDAVTVTNDEDEEQWVVTVPKKIVFSATQGATTHIMATVELSFKENESLNLGVNATIANLRAESVLSATNTKINETTKGYVSGVWLMTANAQIDGANMCNRAEIKRIIDASSDYSRNKLLGNMFRKGIANVDVLGKVQINASVSSLEELLDIDYDFDTYDYGSMTECLNACQKACDVLNANVSAKMYYNGNSSIQGWITFAPSSFYSWGDAINGEYEIESLIEFTDKSTYSLDDYFNESDFSGVTKLWDRLVNAYEDIWD